MDGYFYVSKEVKSSPWYCKLGVEIRMLGMHLRQQLIQLKCSAWKVLLTDLLEYFVMLYDLLDTSLRFTFPTMNCRAGQNTCTPQIKEQPLTQLGAQQTSSCKAQRSPTGQPKVTWVKVRSSRFLSSQKRSFSKTGPSTRWADLESRSRYYM